MVSENTPDATNSSTSDSEPTHEQAGATEAAGPVGTVGGTTAGRIACVAVLSLMVASMGSKGSGR